MNEFHFPPFEPHPLWRNAHLQTILPVYWPRVSKPSGAVNRRINLDDGDALILHDDCPSSWQTGDPVALLVHGLGGSHASPYMPRVAAKLNRRGVRTFRMDLRGHGAGYYLAQHPGHAGRSEDAGAAVIRVTELAPDSPLTVIGISMGGNIVLKMLGEAGDIAPGNVVSAVAVAPPIDIAACSRHMLRPESRIYTRAFTRALIQQVKQRRKFVERLRDVNLEPYPDTIWEFDDRVTAPLSGYHDAVDYYEQASSSPLLQNIAVPTLIISAADDPVVPVEIFRQATYSASTRLIITDHGGHVGYLGRQTGPDPDRRWMDWRIVDWTLRASTFSGREERGARISDRANKTQAF